MADSNIQVKITADDQASGVLNNLSRSASGLGSVLGEVGKIAGTALIAGLGGALAFGVTSFNAFLKAQAEVTLGIQGLKSGLAAMTGTELAALNTALGKGTDNLIGLTNIMNNAGLAALKLGFDDQEASQAFGKLFAVTHDVTEANKDLSLAMDLATNRGIDLATASDLLARVHAGSARVLLNYGLTMKEVGSPAEALIALQQKVGGSAEAMANTTQGKLNILKYSWENLEQTVGGALATAINPMIDALSKWAQDPSTAAQLQILVNDFLAFAQAVYQAASTVEGFISEALQKLIAVWHELSDYFNSDILPTLRALWDIAENFLGPSFAKLWNTLSTQLFPALQQLWQLLAPLLIPALKLMAEILGAALYGAILLVLKVITELANWLAQVLTTITQVATFIVNVAIGAWKGLQDIINAIGDALQRVIDLAQRAAQAVSNAVPKMSAGASLNPFSSSFQLPHFASGGIVTGPTVAMIGEAGPEAVVPLNGSMGFGGTVINITGTFLSEDAAEKLAGILVDRLKLQIKI